MAVELLIVRRWFKGSTFFSAIAETLLSKNSDSNKFSLEYTVDFVKSVAKLFFKVFCQLQTKKYDYQIIIGNKELSNDWTWVEYTSIVEF